MQTDATLLGVTCASPQLPTFSFILWGTKCSATLLDPKTIAFSQANNVGSYCVCLHIAIMYITTISTVHVHVCTLTINNIITMDLKWWYSQLLITRTFREIKKSLSYWEFELSGARSKWASETLDFEFPIDMLYAYSLLVKADIVCHKSNMKQLCFSKQ